MLLINNEIFSNESFHNGETIYKFVDSLNSKRNVIEIRFQDDSDITRLLFAVEYIRDKQPDAELVLDMKYIPYSRMDREIPEGNQIFSMKYFANIINRCNFEEVIALDPHSEVSENLLQRLTKIDLADYVNVVIDLYKPDYIFYPDKGANKKYTEVLKDVDIPHFYGTKVRDLANRGSIIEDRYELHDAPDLTGKKVLIIDDLVSLGGTAYVAGKTLRDNGATGVALYVSHAENGVFYGKLLKPDESVIDRVFTACTTPLERDDKRITIVSV